ncbi:HAMP domain-containing protein [Desulfuromonas versatilis]|uniref:histidine kinase n=1 Tax=Desulfuromonas versatilis TaxID=2802975 RepID=A0ABM8I1W5_9BACT|nr:HAMP domain-containing protein [Desulfuromonas versatilis]BCR06659.1 HAMP domain-containing protein [Desulfuromonas versatilis]
MLRSLTAKAVVPVASAVTGFVIVCCLLLYSFIQGDLVDGAIQREVSLADTIIKSTHYSMLKSDRESLRHTISHIGRQQGVEHVRIFNKKGLIMFSADPAEVNREVDTRAAGCVECHAGPEPSASLGPMEQARRFTNEQGRHVLAITAPIFNEPGCSSGGCHFHLPEQKLLGTLDIGLSEEPLRETLATLRGRMALFCLMVLLLSVGGVCALLRRNVLLPIRELVGYANALRAGETQPLPPEGCEEIETLGRAYQELNRRLRQTTAELEKARDKGADRAGNPLPGEPPAP